MKKRITVKFIMDNDPCRDYPESRVKELIGRGKTLLEVLDLDIPAADRVWVLTRSGVLTRAELVKFAIGCAKRSLPNFEKRYSEDKRPRAAIRAAEKWLIDPSKENAANAAANAAAYAAVNAAAYAAYAAAYAAYAAANAAAYAAYAAANAANAAAYAAVNAAERTAQLKDLRKIIKRRPA